MITYSIIQKLQLEGVQRIDAEYYQPEYLEAVNRISKIPHDTLNDISESLLSFGAYSLTSLIRWMDSGIPFITAQDVKEGFIDFDNVRFIDEKADEILKKSRVHENDVLLAMSGKVGDAAVAVNIPLRLNSNQDIVKIKLKKDFSPFLLAVFLNSKFGRLQVLRLPVGSVQQHIFLWQTKSLLIPKFPREFVIKIEDLHKSGLKELENSKIFYQQAEELLLEELGLKNKVFENELSYVINFSDVKNAERIDPEYFQPKYKEIVGKIEKYNGGFDLVENQFKQNKSLSRKDKDYYNYVEISDISVSNGEITPNRIARQEIPANGKIALCKNDLLVSKVRPYRGAVSFIDFETENLLGSGAFTVLQEKITYKKEVLMIFLKLDCIKDLLLRYNCGTSYPVIKDEDILNLKVPLIKHDIQEKITDLVRKSHEARKKSKELLEEAKRKVEEMIEKGDKNK